MTTVSDCCAIIGVVTAVMAILGCFQRLAGLVIMKRNQSPEYKGNDKALRMALVMSCVETAIGMALLVAVSCGIASALPQPAGEYLVMVLIVAWGAALSLSMVASALLADELIREYSLDVDRSMLPQLIAFVPTVLLFVGLVTNKIGAGIGVAPVMYAGTGVLAISVLAWIGAGAAASSYVTGVVGVLAIIPMKSQKQVEEERVVEFHAPKTTPEQRAAARKINDDDSPIPLD